MQGCEGGKGWDEITEHLSSVEKVHIMDYDRIVIHKGLWLCATMSAFHSKTQLLRRLWSVQNLLTIPRFKGHIKELCYLLF